MRFFLTLFSILILSSGLSRPAPAWADSAPSQARPKDVPWEKMAQTYAATLQAQSDQAEPAQKASAYDARVRYAKLPLDEIPEWKSSPDGAELQKEFERVRGLRFLALPEMKSFLRRIPWLYPDDGCYVRAELATEEISKGESANGAYPTPKKLFVFGDLALKTQNSPDGWVYWWYHVAPVVYLKQAEGVPRSEENVYVLDPAMNPKHPIRLKIWVQSVVGDVRHSKLSLCDATTYGPASQCRWTNPATRSPVSSMSGSDASQKAHEDVQRFLRSEWFRLKGLGRDPRKELSDQPPW